MVEGVGERQFRPLGWSASRLQLTEHSAPSLMAGDLLLLRPNEDVLRIARRKLSIKCVVILGGFLVFYGAAVLLANSLWEAALLLPLLAGSLFAIGTCIMHDSNHSVFASPRVNKVLSHSGEILGVSSAIWRAEHNDSHHYSTNVVGVDLALNQAPLARLAPTQQAHSMHRFQQVYLWPLYGFVLIQWTFVADLQKSWRARSDKSSNPSGARRLPTTSSILLSKAAHLSWAIGIPMMFHRWWCVLLGYMACSWFVGFLLTIVFQVSHCVDKTMFMNNASPRSGQDFANHQLKTTANTRISSSMIGRSWEWLIGGLNFQIEHHLFPKAPHTCYRNLSQEVQSLCHRRGVEYIEHLGMRDAVRSHYRWLKMMGETDPPKAI